MPNCPNCHQLVKAEHITCPHCNYQLKAFGHPGMPLHHAEKNTFLCTSCIYHQDDTCTFPKRPYAKTCTLYQDINQPPQEESDQTVKKNNSFVPFFEDFFCKNRASLILLAIVIISVLLALK